VDSGLGMDVLRIVLGKELGDRFGGSASSPGSTAKGNAGHGTSNSEGQQGKGAANIISVRDCEMDIVPKATKGKGFGEDGRVLSAALSAVCNIVNDFSPLRPVSAPFHLYSRNS